MACAGLECLQHALTSGVSGARNVSAVSPVAQLRCRGVSGVCVSPGQAAVARRPAGQVYLWLISRSFSMRAPSRAFNASRAVQ